jgi:hypothetical protein
MRFETAPVSSDESLSNNSSTYNPFFSNLAGLFNQSVESNAKCRQLKKIAL